MRLRRKKVPRDDRKAVPRRGLGPMDLALPFTEDTPRDVRVERTKEGHVRTFIQGVKFPILGFPHHSLVKSMDPFKGVIRFFVRQLWKHYEKSLPDPRTYTPQVKEIWRVMTLVAQRWTDPNMREFTRQVRDLACLGLEFDLAYREPLIWAGQQIDMKKMRPRREDREWWKAREDFNYGVNKRKLVERNDTR